MTTRFDSDTRTRQARHGKASRQHRPTQDSSEDMIKAKNHHRRIITLSRRGIWLYGSAGISGLTSRKPVSGSWAEGLALECLVICDTCSSMAHRGSPGTSRKALSKLSQQLLKSRLLDCNRHALSRTLDVLSSANGSVALALAMQNNLEAWCSMVNQKKLKHPEP